MNKTVTFGAAKNRYEIQNRKMHKETVSWDFSLLHFYASNMLSILFINYTCCKSEKTKLPEKTFRPK